MHPDIALTDGQFLARRDADLPLDEIPPGDHFGDGVFDLQSGVHLHEEKLSGLSAETDELDRTRAHVGDAAGGIAGGGTDAGPGLCVQQWGRSLLEDLLVASLQAALTIAEVNDIAMAIGQHLYLDVPGNRHEPLQEEGAVAEGRGRFPAGTRQCRRQVGGRTDHPHPFAASPADGLTNTG